jgi:hypothetical protein
MHKISTYTERKRALDILIEAFKNSQGMNWMLSGRRNEKNFSVFLKMFLLEAIVKDGAYLTEKQNGVVLFFRIENKKTSLKLILIKLYVLVFITGIKNGFNALKYRRAVDNIRPKEGWLGWLVASDQSVIGNAAAYEIKQFMFNTADESKQSVYVETTIPRVRLLYQRAGYVEYAEIEHPYNNLKVWFFKREPKL